MLRIMIKPQQLTLYTHMYAYYHHERVCWMYLRYTCQGERYACCSADR